MAGVARRADWRRAAILITCGPEDQPTQTTVAGWVSEAAPGLAVSRMVIDEAISGASYVVTHLASGRVVADRLSYRASRRAAVALGPLANWLAPIPEPKPVVELLELAAVAIARAYRRPASFP